MHIYKIIFHKINKYVHKFSVLRKQYKKKIYMHRTYLKQIFHHSLAKISTPLPRKILKSKWRLAISYVCVSFTRFFFQYISRWCAIRPWLLYDIWREQMLAFIIFVAYRKLFRDIPRNIRNPCVNCQPWLARVLKDDIGSWDLSGNRMNVSHSSRDAFCDLWYFVGVFL